MQTDEIKNVPLVSIVMCTYNGYGYLKEQLDSLCKQTYPSIEIIICDDRSTDNSYTLLEQYAAADKRISLYQNESNLGYALNFTRACRHAKGTYIAIADQDDVWHPDKIKNIIERWEKDVPLMYCNSVQFKGDTIPYDSVPNPGYRRFEGQDSRKLAIYNTISGHALIAKKEFLENHLPFPDGLFYDWWLGVIAACRGGVGYLHETLVFQRLHGTNISVGNGFDPKEKKYKPLFNKMINDHLAAFAETPGMPGIHILFYKKLSVLWANAMQKKFSWKLFFFLIMNRTIIFWHRKRKIGFISHVKHSYRLTRN